MTDVITGLPAALQQQCDRALALEKWPIAQLVSQFEKDTTEAAASREAILTYLESQKGTTATILGITGTPGAGKSSLIGQLCMQLLNQDDQRSVAVVAVDPSSQLSGGALLGDRTRTQFPINEKRLYFRSQASALDLGGMGRKTFQVVRLLRKIFDLVIIETVGIGQSEIEVDRLSDHTLLVMQPLAGDQVQFMKAGIMEVPDTFVINKCDEDTLAKRSYHLLRSSLKLANIYVNEEREQTTPIFLTSATKHKGIQELADHIVNIMCAARSSEEFEQVEKAFLGKWVKDAYGNYGVSVMERYLQNNAASPFTFDSALKQLKGVFNTTLPDPALINCTVTNE